MVTSRMVCKKHPAFLLAAVIEESIVRNQRNDFFTGVLN